MDYKQISALENRKGEIIGLIVDKYFYDGKNWLDVEKNLKFITELVNCSHAQE